MEACPTEGVLIGFRHTQQTLLGNVNDDTLVARRDEQADSAPSPVHRQSS